MSDRRSAYWVNPSELEKWRMHRRLLNLLGRGAWGWERRKSFTKRLLAELIELLTAQMLEVSTRVVSWQLRGKGTGPCEEGR